MLGAVWPFRKRQANATGSREPAHDANPGFRHLTVEVPRHEALTQQFRVADFRLTQCNSVAARLL